MRRQTALVLAVVIAGYSMYGGLFVVGISASGPLETDAGGGETASDAPTTQTRESPEARLQFDAVADSVGFRYADREWSSGTQAMMSNAGVYAVDYDNDGWTDLFATGGASPALFENTGGEFRRDPAFPDLNRTVRAALFFDADNDGWEDLLVLSLDRPPLYLENRNGEFVTRPSAFERPLAVPIGATAGDVTGDGCPDLFVVQNGDWTDRHPVGERNYTVPDGDDNGNPNRLYRGDCSGGFEEVTRDVGIHGDRWSLAATMVDLTGDGEQDIYVANDYNHDVLYVNDGDGTATRREMGERTNRNGMSAEVSDVDGDGRPDVFVTNIYFPEKVAETAAATTGLRAKGNNLLVNSAGGTFEERAEEYDVLRGGWGWAAVAADLDNDVHRDLFHATRWMVFTRPFGEITREEAEELHDRHPFFSYPAVWQGRDGEFWQVSSSGAGFERTDGRGVAALDYDRDGDVDLAVSSFSGEFRLYENRVNTAHESVRVKLSREGNRTALGARVAVSVADRTRVDWYTPESDYLAQDSKTLHFGVGNNSRVDIRVTWPDGSQQRVENVAVGRTYVVSDSGDVRIEDGD